MGCDKDTVQGTPNYFKSGGYDAYPTCIISAQGYIHICSGSSCTAPSGTVHIITGCKEFDFHLRIKYEAVIQKSTVDGSSP